MHAMVGPGVRNISPRHTAVREVFTVWPTWLFFAVLNLVSVLLMKYMVRVTKLVWWEDEI